MLQKIAISVVLTLSLICVSGMVYLVVSPAPELDSVATYEPDAVDSESATTTTYTAPKPAQMPPIEDYARTCFTAARVRNPHGRVLKLTANRLADRCSIIVETDDGSAHWMFDWRNGQADFEAKGEVRWPEPWPAILPDASVVADDYTPERLATLAASSRALWPHHSKEDWLYELIWIPAPFERVLAFVTFDLRFDPDGQNPELVTVFDGEVRLSAQDQDKALALYPLTRFELKEDHNFKGPLFESTALAETAVSLEVADNASRQSRLAANIENCVSWLHKVNTGSRVLRLGLSAEHCYLTLESSATRDDFYLIEASGAEQWSEHPSLALPEIPCANLLLDRSRLSSARVRERLTQAQAADDFIADRIAVAWVKGAMIWQFDGQVAGRKQQVYLTADGQRMDPPTQYPVTTYERDQQFPASKPTLAFVAEAPDP